MELQPRWAMEMFSHSHTLKNQHVRAPLSAARLHIQEKWHLVRSRACTSARKTSSEDAALVFDEHKGRSGRSVDLFSPILLFWSPFKNDGLSDSGLRNNVSDRRKLKE